MRSLAHRADHAAPAQLLRILVVDDNAAVSRQVCRAIERLGCESRASQGADEVLAIVNDWHPSHLILDLVMPSENGISVLQRLAAAGIKVPIILSSGADRRIMEAAARSARLHGLNVTGLLPKPFTRSRLAAILGQGEPSGEAGAAPASIEPAGFEVTPIALDAAIKRGDIRPWLQPQVCCSTGAVVGFEALARWHHPEHGIIMPAAFIDVAETEGLIGRMTLAVANQALHWMGNTAQHPEASIAFNVPPSLLEQKDFTDRLLRSCDRYGVAPGRMVLELTESTRLSHDLAMLERLTLLRLDGVRLSLDDFGIGYSSLLQLAQLPFSEIKIDRSFVSAASRSEESRAIITAIISLARELGMSSVAEGVEDKDTAAFLRSAGCNRIQGYYFSKPVSLQDAKNVRSQYDV